VDPIQGSLIWKYAKPCNINSRTPVPGRTRMEFPDLIRYRDHWYCGFRQADIHENHPSGKGVIIRSADGVKWECVKVISWDGADAGMPRFTITAEGRLMAHEWIHFVSREPRGDGYYYQLDRSTLGLGLTPHSELEKDVASQSLTFFSDDGLTWSSAYACPTGVNTTRFDVTWHNGMAWSVANALGKNVGGVLYRSRDGKSWRVLKEGFTPADQADEAALAFTPDDTLCCLLRGNRSTIAMWGTARGPYYQNWKWVHPQLDSELLRVELGGPTLLRLSDGRLLGAGRTLPPERPDGPWRIDPADPQGKEDGRVVLFWIDAETGVFTRFAEMDGTSYPGIWEYEGHIHVTYNGGDRSGIHWARLPIPPIDTPRACAASEATR
jgi:hypothetical protein